MNLLETIAKVEGAVRPLLASVLDPALVVDRYSHGRQWFLKKLKDEQPKTYAPPDSLERTLWGMKFRTPLLNAAGMFKNGEWEYHELMLNQGAGAFLAGTTTANPRDGYANPGMKIHLPFAPYPRSHAASNKLGLPNDGDEVISQRIASLPMVDGFPVGVSLMGSPDIPEDGYQRLDALVKGMHMYEKAGVDFIEINESCPNTGEKLTDVGLLKRLNYVSRQFLSSRKKNLPIVVKISNDFDVKNVPELIDMLVGLGFNGVNFGNTSTSYEDLRNSIHRSERHLYDFFTSKFEGGVSGRPLNSRSLLLAGAAAKYVRENCASADFNVIRTGGIESAQDLIASDAVGVKLNQWFTGYFEGFAKHGHNVFRRMYEDYNALRKPA